MRFLLMRSFICADQNHLRSSATASTVAIAHRAAAIMRCADLVGQR
jgi:hypothetical protein